MIYYRVALRGNQAETWCLKSEALTSLHTVLGLLNMYRCIPKERICVFLTTAPELMDGMLSLANQGLPSTAISAEQLWDKNCVSWIQVRRLELELGPGGDYDEPYNWCLPPSYAQSLAWMKLLARRERGELVP